MPPVILKVTVEPETEIFPLYSSQFRSVLLQDPVEGKPKFPAPVPNLVAHVCSLLNLPT